MVSTAGGIVIAIVVILVAAAVGWVVFTQLRARRLGLPPPSLSSYLPWHKADTPYGPPRPARGGVVGWFNDVMRKFKHRNDRSAAGAYEQSLHSGSGPGNRGFGPLDPDDAWDSRVGNEADGYGYYEQELGGHTEYTGANYGGSRLGTGPAAHAGYDEDVERGRRPSRDAGAATAAEAGRRQNPLTMMRRQASGASVHDRWTWEDQDIGRAIDQAVLAVAMPNGDRYSEKTSRAADGRRGGREKRGRKWDKEKKADGEGGSLLLITE
ncbi:hypothetical protein TrVFT333_001153 [Trichoderma virens FT-333]|nr:hypothetical protein TrVFT333_001153 [Trichoderma virens FT-333]